MYDQLQVLGLTKTEAKLYLALVELGRSQAGILSRKTGIHRRSVYDALERLIEKGLVSYIRENDKRFYLAEDPKRLEELAQLQKKAIDEVVPDLAKIFLEHKEKQETKFYRGIEGLKNIFEDQITEGKPVYIIGASRKASEILKYYLPHYTSKRVKNKLKMFLIYAGEKRDFAVPYGETRYLPESYDSPVSTNIYGEKVAIIVWGPEPVAILIKNTDIAKTYMHYFNLLWSTAQKRKEGPAQMPKMMEE
ncbi:MAG: helix-turn-helix domain-containing protein [Candidatus Woesearchaeota archaeon]